MNKVKLLWWGIVLLVILNMTTIGTIVYHNITDTSASDGIMLEPKAAPLNGRCFKETLGFDSKQMDSFRSYNQGFKKKANEVVHELNFQKEQMFQELKKEQPDAIKLNQIATRIGQLHTQLKEETVHFYLSLKGICTKEQEVKLQTLFTPLFENTTQIGKQRNGNRHRNLNK